jgi:cytosine/adenosine deaminase-related metal-dependent hydrolase
MHVGCGNFGPRYGAIAQLYQAGLLGPDLNFAHCNSLTTAEFTLLADHGCSVSITPEVEMQMNMGFPATGKALASGLRPGLGVDVVTATGGDLFGQMKLALQTERAFQNAAYLQKGEMPQRVSLSVYDALQLATIDGARTLGLERKIGSLTPGKQADVIMLDARSWNLFPVSDPVAAVVLAAHAGNVDSVFVAGKPLKRNGQLLGRNLPSLQAEAEASRQYLLEQAPVSMFTAGAPAGGA